MSQSSGWYQRLPGFWQLIRADRPIGIYLLLWPTLWALWLAGEGQPDWHIVLIFVLGTLLMRSAGCAINDYADRHFDGNVERTRQRPLVTGQVRPGEALAVTGLLALLAASLLWWLNTPTRWQAVVAVALAAVYPFSKRYMPLPQLILGIAFAWSIPMAFSALQGATSLLTWVLFFVVVAWTIAYDTAYAMVDRENDLKIGVQSSAILFSHYDRLVIGILQGLVIVLLGVVGWLAGRGGIYALGLVIGAGLFVYQQALLRRRERDAYFCAFLNNHPFGLVICAALVLDYWVYPTE
ncbi:MAG: 4-hydroxybenzoate octaprenyltransferase [Pseudomonadota bacterium]